MVSFRQHGPAKIAAVFAAFGLLWVLGSELVVARVFSPDAWLELGLLKGAAFVLAGSGLIYLFIGWFQEEEEELIGELAEKRTQLKRAQRIGDMGSWELDLATGDLTWSDHIYRIFGSSADDVDPDYQTFLSFVHPEDREEMKAAQEEVLSGGEDLDIEHRIVRPDGQVRWVREQGQLVRRDGEAVALSGTVQDVTERKELEEQLRYRALHDPLTELPNRLLFDDRLETALEAARQESVPLALLILDLKRLKKINESYGHASGDWVLQEVARRLASCVREKDTVARVGGDEFGVILEVSEDRDSVEKVTDRIEAVLGEPFALAEDRVQLEAQCGIARYRPADESSDVVPDSAEGLMRHAHLALDWAKEEGRQRFFSTDADLPRTGQLQQERRLREAVEREEFEVHYQPIVELDSGKIVGLEALARWRDPDRGLLGPGEFIPLAEESGLIQPLGRALLRDACEGLSEWERMGRVQHPLTVSVNLSARQLDDEELVPAVTEILGQATIDPERLQLEITETAILRAHHSIAPLRNQGIRVAIDDFGTGYASYTYLRELDVDALKLDMSFVQGADTDERDRAICQTVVDLADAFGLSAVAEGIETPEQLELLRSMGCPVGQGYLLARPAPTSEIMPLVEEGAISGPYRS